MGTPGARFRLCNHRFHPNSRFRGSQTETEELIAHFRNLGRYNRLANERLYDACSALMDEQRNRFEYPDGEAPTFLETDYGIEQSDDDPDLNIGQIIQEDIEFADSTKSSGIQVADLLASGVRRVLRQQFKDNDQAAVFLGGLMPQREKGSPSVQLLGFSRTQHFVRDEVAHVVRLMERCGRPLIVH